MGSVRAVWAYELLVPLLKISMIPNAILTCKWENKTLNNQQNWNKIWTHYLKNSRYASISVSDNK